MDVSKVKRLDSNMEYDSAIASGGRVFRHIRLQLWLA